MYVLLDHQLSAEAVERLGDTLSALTAHPAFPYPETGTGYLARGGFTWWLDIEMNFRSPSAQLAEIGHISLDIPRGLAVHLGEHLVCLKLPIHWHDFVCDPERRDTARSVVRTFAATLGAGAAIYLDEGDVSIGRTVDDRRALTWLIDWLDARFGPPAMTVEAIPIHPIAGAERKTYWVESLAP